MYILQLGKCPYFSKRGTLLTSRGVLISGYWYREVQLYTEVSSERDGSNNIAEMSHC